MLLIFIAGILEGIVPDLRVEPTQPVAETREAVVNRNPARRLTPTWPTGFA